MDCYIKRGYRTNNYLPTCTVASALGVFKYRMATWPAMRESPTVLFEKSGVEKCWFFAMHALEV